MKKETARREIEALDYYLQNHTNDYSEESHMAMMMAIKALQQEPCEDAVSRQAVCNIVDAIRDCISVEGYWAILERLKKLPSVKPQKPKTGYWKPFDRTFGRNIYYCTSCEHSINMEMVFNYCPNCGCHMIDPQESEVKE